MPTATSELPPCAHYWVIAPSNGSESSVGQCRICGEIKVFKNSFGPEDVSLNWARGRKQRAEETAEGESE